ncbi:choice-of-anchor tandem repeat GloVer-containing protein [uncultured Flavobacterium sp.]|uniref:choice-of-anchor tandem repeat GloVer-containing protein n=1 Tax=uncultured Flavobacterium sp. TaxID=165435 RepID=UPI0025CBB4D0|nr:choice-of-anchor tandem repeat GloVer-containing protein [uncultured Flavobacterium sp.]
MHTFLKLFKAALAAAMLFVLYPAYGQKELWGYMSIPANNQIVSIDPDDTFADTRVMHNFDPTGVLGRYPRSRLLEGSNGKLYGIAASQGGQDIPNGVLFEYNPVTEEYRVLNSSIINGGNGGALIEPTPGWLYGTTNQDTSIFKYNIETEEATIVATLPQFPYQLGTLQPKFNGELMKASDGHLYITTGMAPSPQNTPFPGGIYRLNTTSQQLTKVYVFGWGGSDIRDPMGRAKLIEALPGKLYGTSLGGANVGPQGVAPSGSGTIFEYTIASATMVKKFDFNYNVDGRSPGPLTMDGGKLYGLLPGFSNDNLNYPNRRGSLFEYDVATEAFTLLHNFTQAEQVRLPLGFVLKASNGKFYFGAQHGHYEFDPASGMATLKNGGGSNYQPLIEICRKPYYSLPETTAFTVCEGEPFSFDTQNSNAHTYVWKKGSILQPFQATAVLSFGSTAVTDSGIYTCTMTNECGTIVTLPIQLTVEACMGVGAHPALQGIKLYPNPAAGILNIQLPQNAGFELQNVSAVNMLGQTVYSGRAHTIDTSGFAPGVYQLIISTDKGNRSDKFIKQ